MSSSRCSTNPSFPSFRSAASYPLTSSTGTSFSAVLGMSSRVLLHLQELVKNYFSQFQCSSAHLPPISSCSQDYSEYTESWKHSDGGFDRRATSLSSPWLSGPAHLCLDVLLPKQELIRPDPGTLIDSVKLSNEKRSHVYFKRGQTELFQEGQAGTGMVVVIYQEGVVKASHAMPEPSTDTIQDCLICQPQELETNESEMRACVIRGPLRGSLSAASV